jgi:hypothetical protein
MLPWFGYDKTDMDIVANAFDKQMTADTESIMDMVAVYEHARARIDRGINPRDGKKLKESEKD